MKDPTPPELEACAEVHVAHNYRVCHHSFKGETGSAHGAGLNQLTLNAGQHPMFGAHCCGNIESMLPANPRTTVKVWRVPQGKRYRRRRPYRAKRDVPAGLGDGNFTVYQHIGILRSYILHEVRAMPEGYKTD